MTTTLVRSGDTITITKVVDLSWSAPISSVIAAGTTTGSITWLNASGGQTPYTYSNASVVYDSAGESTTASFTTAGSAPGVTSFSSLVNGQTVVVSRTVTDANGNTVTIQAAVTVGATSASLTVGSAPESQRLTSGSTSAVIGTWGATSGGTGPYTYELVDATGGGTTITGTGLGQYTATGLSDGQTYVYLLTVTDSLGAKGYSVVTISVASVANIGDWIIEDDLDFTDPDWTAMSSTNATASTTAWQHTLYAADGVTPRCYVYTNSTAARTLSLSPSGNGLTLVNGTAAVQPSIGIWPAGWEVLIGGSRKDLWLVEAIVAGKEPSGTGAFVHIFTLSRYAFNNVGTGLRNINSSSNSLIRVVSYISSAAEQTIQTVSPGSFREYTAGVQVTINDQRQHDVYVRVGSTDYGDPLTGQKVRVQTASTTMTAAAGSYPTSAPWFDPSILSRTKFWLYHDGSSTTNSEIRLVKLRLLRKVNGST